MRTIPSLAIIWFFCSSLFAQEKCCEIPDCAEEAIAFAEEMVGALDPLGPFPLNNDSLPILERQEKGNKFEIVILHPERWSDQQLTQFKEALVVVEKLKHQPPLVADCIFANVESLDVMEWWSFFNSLYTGKTKLPSPHFKKGSYYMVNIRPFGAIRPFQSGEGYSSSYSVTFGRTIKRNDPLKDRRLRWNIGTQLLYQREEATPLGLAALDWKLGDIAFDAFNIGLTKLQVQVFAGDDIMGGEVGFGIEAFALGFNLISIGYQDIDSSTMRSGWYFQSGILLNVAELLQVLKPN